MAWNGWCMPQDAVCQGWWVCFGISMCIEGDVNGWSVGRVSGSFLVVCGTLDLDI
jgi:hypothetical protein